VTKRPEVVRRIPCPVPLCQASLQKLKRHIKRVHKLTSDEADNYLANSKDYRSRGGDVARGVPRQRCPMAGCTAFVIKLNDHLHSKHKTTTKLLGIGKPDNVSLPPLRVPGFHPSEAQPPPFVSADHHQTDDDPRSNESTDVKNALDLFEEHMGGMDGGRRRKPFMYRLALKQIIMATGGGLNCLIKEKVKKLYVDPVMVKRAANSSEMSMKTLRHKITSLKYFCIFATCADSGISISSEMKENFAVLIR